VFTSYDLDKDEETQKKILEMIPDIEKYYVTTRWCYKKETKKNKKYLSVIKSVIKEMNIDVVSLSKKMKINGNYVAYMLYMITSNIDGYI
jgi:hypothetical protein